MRMALALIALAFAPGAATPDITGLVLQPQQVGAGYSQSLQPAGQTVNGQVTLNLCGVGYQSERFRTARLQLDYQGPNSMLGISNEVVTYRSAGAADAMRELAHRVATCPHRPVDTGAMNGPKLQFTFTRITDPHLLKGYIALRIVVAGVIKGKRIEQTSYAVYQRRGNVLSGVYSFGLDTPAQRALALHAAEGSARNLRSGSCGCTSAPAA